MLKEKNQSLIQDISNILKPALITNWIKEAEWIAEVFPEPLDAIKIAKERAKHKPLQYLLGEWEFYNLNIKLGRGVFIPRPETEQLVEYTLEKIKDINTPKLLDLCTGSGCIAFAIEKERPDADITAIDNAAKAEHYFKINAENLGSKVKFIKQDCFLLPTVSGFDVIVCNPPYLSAEEMTEISKEVGYEPAAALTGARNIDGNRYYNQISRNWKTSLKDGGILIFEIGAKQAKPVTEFMKRDGYSNITTLKDFSELDRIVSGVR
jgi:release factor glutamine methyltransferase